MVFSFVMSPLPLQPPHGLVTTVPRPLQRWHTRSTAIGRSPCWKRTRPRPLHALHVSACEPFAEPDPRQSPHETIRS